LGLLLFGGFMSLKTDYFDGTTGLQAKCNDAFDAGVTFIGVTNLSTISAALISAAAAGQTQFTVTLITTYQPSFLRGNKGDNLILKSYLAGIKKGLADQDIYDFECTPSLNVSDSVDTKIDLKFNFQTT
jgi:hypothetical protein